MESMTGKLTGREYLRVSVDKSKKGRSPNQQHLANVPSAASFNIEIVGTAYRDVDRSASRYATKDRENFDRLIEDLRAGTFGADVLILWENSRGSRKVSEWVLLLELLEQRGVLVLVTADRRLYDPRVPRDRKSLLDDAVDSEYESAKDHLRIKRDIADSAARGWPHGKCPYGYERLYDERTRRFVSQHEHPVEGPIIRELFERLAKGDYLASIERDFEARGVTTRKGAKLTAVNLRSMAENVAYAGYRVHDPERWLQNRHSPTENGQKIKAVWPPLVPLRRYLAVQKILSQPSRRIHGDNRTKHLLSMILKCDVCGGPLSQSNGLRTGAPSAQGVLDRHYRCAQSHVRIKQQLMDDLAKAMIMSFATHPDSYRKLIGQRTNDAELARVQDDLAAARAEHEGLADSGISLALAARREPAVLARIATLSARERELDTPPELTELLLSPGDDMEARWEALTIIQKRSLLRTLLSPEYFGELRIVRTNKRGRGVQVPVADRIVLRRSRRGKVTDVPMSKLKVIE